MKKLNCILLVDDDHTDNLFHSNRILKSGVCEHIEIAYDGKKALDYLMEVHNSGEQNNHPKPDLIYLDINMPKMNGFEFLENYGKLDEKVKSDIVIIMLTTSLNPDDRKKALQFKEVNEFQTKPLSVESVIETVEKYF